MSSRARSPTGEGEVAVVIDTFCNVACNVATVTLVPTDRRPRVPVSLKDVALRAGVSVRTVSNVVNDFPWVAPETRARVQRAIDELQYRPNAAARQLRGGRSGLIGLIIPEIASPYFGEVAALLTRGAEERSWTLLVDQTDGDADRERRLLDGVRGHVV